MCLWTFFDYDPIVVRTILTLSQYKTHTLNHTRWKQKILQTPELTDKVDSILLH